MGFRTCVPLPVQTDKHGKPKACLHKEAGADSLQQDSDLHSVVEASGGFYQKQLLPRSHGATTEEESWPRLAEIDIVFVAPLIERLQLLTVAYRPQLDPAYPQCEKKVVLGALR